MENKSKIYKSEIEPKINELLSICNDNGIPFFMVFGIDTDENGKFKLAAQSMIPEEFHYVEKDRRFSDFINVMNGFETVPKKRVNTIMEDEFGDLPTGYGGFIG